MQSIRNSRDGIVGRAKSSADAPKIEAFAQAFLERLAGSQGRALSRVPQDTESPFDFRFCENQPKNKKKRRPQTAQYFAHKVRSLGKANHSVGLSFFVCFD